MFYFSCLCTQNLGPTAMLNASGGQQPLTPSAALAAHQQQQQQLIGPQITPGAGLPLHHLPPQPPSGPPGGSTAQIPDVSAAVAAAIEASTQPMVTAAAPAEQPPQAGLLQPQQAQQVSESPFVNAPHPMGDVAMPQAPNEEGPRGLDPGAAAAAAASGPPQELFSEPSLALEQPAHEAAMNANAVGGSGSGAGHEFGGVANSALHPSPPPRAQSQSQSPAQPQNHPKPPEGSLVATLMEEFDVDFADLVTDLDPEGTVHGTAEIPEGVPTSPRASFQPSDGPFAAIQDPLSSSASLRESPRSSPPRPGSAACESDAMRVASLSGWMHGSPGNLPSPRGTPAGPSHTARTTAGTVEQPPPAAFASTPVSGSPPYPIPEGVEPTAE